MSSFLYNFLQIRRKKQFPSHPAYSTNLPVSLSENLHKIFLLTNFSLRVMFHNPGPKMENERLSLFKDSARS